jgi:hypothetical protein
MHQAWGFSVLTALCSNQNLMSPNAIWPSIAEELLRGGIRADVGMSADGAEDAAHGRLMEVVMDKDGVEAQV